MNIDHIIFIMTSQETPREKESDIEHLSDAACLILLLLQPDVNWIGSATFTSRSFIFSKEYWLTPFFR